MLEDIIIFVLKLLLRGLEWLVDHSDEFFDLIQRAIVNFDISNPLHWFYGFLVLVVFFKFWGKAPPNHVWEEQAAEYHGRKLDSRGYRLPTLRESIVLANGTVTMAAFVVAYTVPHLRFTGIVAGWGMIAMFALEYSAYNHHVNKLLKMGVPVNATWQRRLGYVFSIVGIFAGAVATGLVFADGLGLTVA